MDVKIGIDIGNVLTQRDTDVAPFGKDYLNVPAYEGTFESVGKLVEWFGGTNIFLVSKCSMLNQRMSREWLFHRNFFKTTGVPFENLYFCEKRHQKRIIAEEHRLNYFIDDRWSVLRHLDDLDLMNKLYLFNPFPEEKSAFESEYTGEKILMVESWAEIIHHINPDK
ncbi:MAG: hypothetical protein HYZ23_06635 [Chloroflexi bacterium]|nr:hypothetical protein [Chloroflexota bacterium]